MPIQNEKKIFPFRTPNSPEKRDNLAVTVEEMLAWAEDVSQIFNDINRQVIDNFNLHLGQTHGHPKSWKYLRVQRPAFRSNPSDTSQVIVDASATKPQYFVIGENIYEATSNLTMDLDTAGTGGLRSGLSKAANTIYYLYGVLNSSGAVALLADTNDPDTGPSGYTDWTYLGGFCTIAASAIAAFSFTDGFMLCQDLPSVTVSNATPATAKTLQIPTTATKVYMRTNWTAVNLAGDDLFVGPTSASAVQRNQATSTTASSTALSTFWVPVITAQTVYANVTTVTTDSASMVVIGWQEDPRVWK